MERKIKKNYQIVFTDVKGNVLAETVDVTAKTLASRGTQFIHHNFSF